jgi:hypothetical protein
MTIDIKDIVSPTGKTYVEELISSAEYLKKCLQDELDIWYASHTPSNYYKRRKTNSLRTSIVDNISNINVDVLNLSINIEFDEMSIYHKSWFRNGYVNVLWLMNYGYSVKKDVWFKNYKYFGYRDGGEFIEKAIAKFNATNTLGFVVTPMFNGKPMDRNVYNRTNDMYMPS